MCFTTRKESLRRYALLSVHSSFLLFLMEHLPSVLVARQKVADAATELLALADKARSASRPADCDFLKRGANAMLEGAEAVLTMSRAVEAYHFAAASAALCAATPRPFSGEPMLAASAQKRTVHGRTRGGGGGGGGGAGGSKRGGGAAAKRKNTAAGSAPKRATTAIGTFVPRAAAKPPADAAAAADVVVVKKEPVDD
jgi:hypothetical protein